MKKVFFILWVLIGLGLFTACNTTKKTTSTVSPKSAELAISPLAGDWNFVISNTPMGDVEGLMSLASSAPDNSWGGKMMTSQGAITFQSVKVIEKNVTAVFDYDGVPVTLNLQFEQETFTGKAMVSGYGDFAMKGQRKNNLSTK